MWVGIKSLAKINTKSYDGSKHFRHENHDLHVTTMFTDVYAVSVQYGRSCSMSCGASTKNGGPLSSK